MRLTAKLLIAAGTALILALGAGTIRAESPTRRTERPACETCNDRRVLNCPDCRKQVILWCSQCRRRHQCELCRGLGQVPCPKCGVRNGKQFSEALRAEIEAKTKQIERTIGKKLLRIETPLFIIFTDLPHMTAHQYARRAERAYTVLQKHFPVKKSQVVWNGKCFIFLFQRPERFEQFVVAFKPGSKAPEQAGGLAWPTPVNPTLALFRGNHTDDDLYRTMVHELAHLFLQLFDRPVKIHDWIHEGVAQFFEFKHRTRQDRVGRWKRLVARAVRSRRHMPWTQFVNQTLSPADHLGYAQAWSITAFLVEKSQGRYGKFLLNLKTGLDQDEALKQSFGVSLDRMERAWMRYVDQNY